MITTSILMDGLEWLWGHWPDIAVLIVLLVFGIWLTVKVNNFIHRFENTERLCNDIHTRQLPEIRTELKAINDRLSKIELSLNTIVTWLAKGNKINL